MRLEVDVPHMLSALGVQNVELANDEVYYSCPFPGHAHGDAKPSASMNADTTSFNCWGCGAHGNAVTFVAMLLDVPPWTARRWLKEAYAGDFREPVGSLWDELKVILDPVQEGQVEQRVVPDMDDVRSRAVDWERVESAMREGGEVPRPLRYMLERGFTPRTLEAWEVGYDAKSGRIAIPVRDPDGKVVGFKGRSPDGSPKYVVLGGKGYSFDTYEVSSVLFGSHMMRGRSGVLVEGELNVLALWQAGIDGGLATGGAKVSATQMSAVRGLCDEVCLWFDDDPAGRKATRRHIDKLHASMPVRYVLSKEDAADLSAEECRAVLDGAVHPLHEAYDSLEARPVV